jgi:beta-phosphoglucomutase-like phosphatase (HAD superfamily)
VTPTVDHPDALREILATTEALLLDFDGPVCSVFAGIPAPTVADQLRQVLAEGGYTDLPDDVRVSEDPFDLLFYAAKLGHNEARYVEAAFRAHEVEAVQSAQPTPSSAEVMRAWRATGRPMAVVSNNSEAAVETYLDIHDLRTRVTLVSARATADVALLKPNPFLVVEAIRQLAVVPSRSALVGDSVTDVEASRAARVTAIGFANKAGKAKQFDVADVDTVITHMGVLLDAISAF